MSLDKIIPVLAAEIALAETVCLLKIGNGCPFVVYIKLSVSNGNRYKARIDNRVQKCYNLSAVARMINEIRGVSMKRICIFVLAMILAAMSSCSSGENGEKSAETTRSDIESIPDAGTRVYEDALENSFYAQFDPSRNDELYSYILPQSTIDILRENGDYYRLFAVEHSHDHSDADDADAVLENVLRSQALDKEQLHAAENYLTRISKGYGAEITGLTVSEGWEVEYRFYAFSTEQTVTECFVLVEGDGWKKIPMDKAALSGFGDV